MKPFDPRSVIFAQHAQHVVLVHFPIALCLVGIAFDFTSEWKKSPALSSAAYYNLLVAAISTLPVIITGLLAWHFQLEGQRLKGTLLLHLASGISASCLIWLVWYLHWRTRRGSPCKPFRSRWPIEALTALVIGITAHLGGFLSGVNGGE